MGKTRRPWTTTDDAYVREHWETSTVRVIAEDLGRSENLILRHAHKQGLSKRRPYRGSIRQSWEPAEVEYLAKQWRAGALLTVIAKQLGRSVTAVQTKASTMNLGRQPIASRVPAVTPAYAATTPAPAPITAPVATVRRKPTQGEMTQAYRRAAHALIAAGMEPGAAETAVVLIARGHVPTIRFVYGVAP